MRQTTPDSRLALFQVVLSGFLYSWLGYFGVLLMRDGFSLSSMLFWRFFGSAAFLFLLVVTKKTFIVPNARQIRQFALWALYYCGCSGFYFLASTYLGVGLAMVIFFSFPAMVILISWLKGERKISLFTLVNLALLFPGIALLHPHQGMISFDLLGIVIALLAAFSYALYIVGTANQKVRIDSLNAALYVSLGSAIFFLMDAFLRGKVFFPSNMYQIANICGIAILATALPMVLMLQGLTKMDKGRAAILSVLEPVGTVIIGHFFLQEGLAWQQILGTLIVLGVAVSIQFE